MKSSYSIGHDSSSIKIYKLINNRISPHITHLINSIITKGIYPDILKQSGISPLKNLTNQMTVLNLTDQLTIYQ